MCLWTSISKKQRFRQRRKILERNGWNGFELFKLIIYFVKLLGGIPACSLSFLIVGSLHYYKNTQLLFHIFLRCLNLCFLEMLVHRHIQICLPRPKMRFLIYKYLCNFFTLQKLFL